MQDQEIKFKSAGFNLAGSLRLPESGKPRAVVLLITGSGPIDRNENYKKMRINVFKDMADYLEARQIASFRYDKRGVAQSEGNFLAAGFYDNVSDAAAAVDYLKTVETFRNKPVFVAGHSEGALISTRLAASRTDVAAILLAGAAQTGEDILKWQAGEVVKTLNGFTAFIIRLFRINVLKSQQKALNKIKNSTKDWYRQQLFAKINAKWFREFMAYNPAADMAKIKVPVLALTGSKDIQVNPADLKRMAEILKTDFEYHEIPGVSHLLREAKGNRGLSDYKRQVKQPIDSRLLDYVGSWLDKHI